MMMIRKVIPARLFRFPLKNKSAFLLPRFSFSSSGQEKFDTGDFIDIGSSTSSPFGEGASANASIRMSVSKRRVVNGKKEQGFGKLTVCPTPLGNLNDMSVRQYQALLEADVIASEDTRITGMLLKLIKIRDIKGNLAAAFGATHLAELKGDGSSSTKKNADDLNDEDEDDSHLLESDLIESVTQTRLSREERIQLKVLELRSKARQVLKEADTLDFFDEKEDENPDEGPLDASTYGLEDEFIRFLRAKIALSKKRKGRGILISYHKFNEENRIAKLLKMMRYGLNIVLVSDAGTPTISDPGFRIINSCIDNHIHVDSLPGPNSAVLALSKSGYPSQTFKFVGYLPKVQQDREQVLYNVMLSKNTSVILESVNRLFKTLNSIEKIFGAQQEVFLAFEMTKLHEKNYRGKVRELYELLNDPSQVKTSHLKGELTMVIPPFLPEFNETLSNEGENRQKEKQFYLDWQNNEDSKSIMIEPKMVASILNDALDSSDKDLAELLSKILKISKSRAMSLVGVTKHFSKRTRNWDHFLPNYANEIKRNEQKEKIAEAKLKDVGNDPEI